MKGKRPRWLVNAIRYEKGFIAFAWSEIKKGKAFYVKSLALFVIVAGTISGLLSSFEDTEVYRSGYGIKAATCALGAAGIVFIGMIPTASSADPFIRALGGAFAFLAGTFWLLAETGGNIQTIFVGGPVDWRHDACRFGHHVPSGHCKSLGRYI